ncbi:synaptotagmin-1-like isoform X2 [Acanthaster planci]|uniref:Synaptotagmin-1-like isoform X2 n=1 Tax=Acanthaster planci TaxID=133434 RepID=A0A8B8A142_ACAPL|nr:synaptotagmin-1-like isoform X2 [Acanthaster planci]
MHNFSVVPLLREPQPVSPPTPEEGYAPLPYPIPVIIAILVGAQIVIIVSILLYVLSYGRNMEKSAYREIGRSPLSGSRFWKKVRKKLGLREGDRCAKASAKYSIQDATFLEKWREKKREMVVPHHVQTMSRPIEFSIPTKTETLVRPKASEKLRQFPLPPMRKPSKDPWMSPSFKRPRNPNLSSAMRTRSLQTEERKASNNRMARSHSVPINLGEAASALADQVDQTSAYQTAIGEIEPDLYRIDEQHELYTPSKFGLGKLSFSLFYDEREGQLTVYLIQAVQLPARTERATADTYVMVSLLPDEEKKSATSKNFIFRVPEEDVIDTVIKLTVVGLDGYSHPVPIGQVVYPLRTHDFGSSSSDVSQPIWRDIEKSDSPEEPRQGDILVSLTYLPTAERVTVAILKARNLRLPESEEPEARKLVMDTFVKVTVVKGDKVVKNKQTSVVRRNANPTFNEAFTIDMSSEDEQVCIVFAVCLRVNPFAGHKTLGRCLVGPDEKATGDGAAHWRDMMATPRSAVAEWHPLK